MSQILIAGRHPLYRQSVTNLLRLCETGISTLQARRFDQFSANQLANARSLILCDYDQPVAKLGDKLLLSGCGFTTQRVLFTEHLESSHQRCLAEGAVDLILPMAVGWRQAQSYLKRLLVDCESSVGFQALQDPELVKRFLPVPNSLNNLTLRERQVLKYLNKGMSNKLIAQQMAITINTVKVHMARICKKAGGRNRTQALSYFAQLR